RLTTVEQCNVVAIGKPRAGIQAGKESRKDRQCQCPGRAWRKTRPVLRCRAAICFEIGPGILEFLQKTIIENVHFVKVCTAEQGLSMVAHIAGFDGNPARKLALDTEGPLLHVRSAQIAVDCRKSTQTR